MKIQIIPIDRATIAKNPNVGRTRTTILLNTNIDFEYKNISFEKAQEIEELEKKHHGIFVTNTDWNENEITSLKGVIYHESLLQLLPKENLIYDIKNNYQHIGHLPEAAYLYNYKDNEIECQNIDCKHKVKISEILYDDEGNEQCPYCLDFSSFNYEYEKIEDCIKDMNITQIISN